MKTKQIWILLFILAVLGAGTFLRQIQKPAELSFQETIPLNLSFDEGKIQKILIRRIWAEQDGIRLPSQRAELVKTGPEWFLPGVSYARVNSQKVTEFFRQIREARGEQRAEGKQFFGDFQIAEDDSFRVSLYSENEKPELEFFLGVKTASGSYFIRRKDSDVIYLTETNFFAQMGIYGDPAKENLMPEIWAAADFLKLDAEKVRGIEIKAWNNKNRETIKTALELREGKWHFKNSGIKTPASDQKVKDFLSGMASLTAEKVLSGDAKDFSKPVWQMTVSFEGGETRVFKGADRNEETGLIFFQASENGAAYQVPKYYFDNLDKDDAYFTEDKPAETKPEAAVSSK